MTKDLSRKNVLFERIGTVLTTSLFVLYLIPVGWCLTQGKTLPDAPVTQVKIEGDKMIIQGTIDPGFAQKVHDVLTQPHVDIKTVLVSSIGGDEPSARKIAQYLSDLGPHKTVIPSKFQCLSSCILLMTDKNSDFEPADDATLMFHRGWDRIGPDSCAACRLVAWEINHFKDTVFGNSWHQLMYPWAEALAPGFGKKLSECDPNPFDTIEGRTITGKQFKDFRNGQTDALACPTRSAL